jgi:hypothetical protein
MGNNKVAEKKVDNDVKEEKADPKEVLQSLRVQLTEHQKQAEHHSTMAVKAQGALEVLVQMHPELQETK